MCLRVSAKGKSRSGGEADSSVESSTKLYSELSVISRESFMWKRNSIRSNKEPCRAVTLLVPFTAPFHDRKMADQMQSCIGSLRFDNLLRIPSCQIRRNALDMSKYSLILHTFQLLSTEYAIRKRGIPCGSIFTNPYCMPLIISWALSYFRSRMTMAISLSL